MKIRLLKLDDEEPIRRWFAWKPVTVFDNPDKLESYSEYSNDRQVVWLQWLYVKSKYVKTSDRHRPYWKHTYYLQQPMEEALKPVEVETPEPTIPIPDVPKCFNTGQVKNPVCYAENDCERCPALRWCK